MLMRDKPPIQFGEKVRMISSLYEEKLHVIAFSALCTAVLVLESHESGMKMHVNATQTHVKLRAWDD
ncbi:hypothetical protein T11_11093 [Trichinella zimbabwensis]|uniref:Uncharacterized protein n=1 Tax=Trichinella zimbabwensis TaxID=268475 RepID=A0A0V1I974_9BILA|nr:hypothetical protein T11_11093 [Trichinella zimbabwensis]